MTADETNVARAMSDGRWRTATDVAIRAGIPEIKAQDALEALAREGRIQRERPAGVSIYRAKGKENGTKTD